MPTAPGSRRVPIPVPPPLPDEVLPPIVRFIRKERKARGWSQRTLEEFAGVGSEIVAHWERGMWKPSLDSIEKVLGALGWDLVAQRTKRATDTHGS